MEQLDSEMKSSFGSYKLNRYPLRKKETLRAWDAADEYVLNHLAENKLPQPDSTLLIVNDGFGGLSVALNNFQPVVMTDSYLSMQAISLNLERNGIAEDAVTVINSLQDPDSVLNKKADIVLIGVSRTSKTPLSQYLAHKKYKVMNVPLVPEVTPPHEIYNIDPGKCVGLKINAPALNKIRKERLTQLGLKDTANYAGDQSIQEELDYFNEVIGKIGCPVIDVSDKAIEETANVILDYVEKRLEYKD